MFSYKIIFCFVSLILAQLSHSVVGISFKEDVTLSREQKGVLDQFKTRVVPKLPDAYMRTEMNLIKWLRSSNFDVDVAEGRILRNVDWRKEQKMDDIHSEDWSDMWNEDFRYYLDGRDKAGRSFLFLDIKDIDVRRVVLQGKGNRLLRYVDKIYDEGCSLIRSLGEKYGNMTRGHTIVNLDGFNQAQHTCIRCLPFLLKMLFSYNSHWPECVDKIFLVNSPSTVHQFIQIARPYLDDVLRRSILVFGSDKKEWKKALGKEFDFSQLPPVLGGTKLYKGMQAFDDFDLETNE